MRPFIPNRRFEKLGKSERGFLIQLRKSNFSFFRPERSWEDRGRRSTIGGGAAQSVRGAVREARRAREMSTLSQLFHCWPALPVPSPTDLLRCSVLSVRFSVIPPMKSCGSVVTISWYCSVSSARIQLFHCWPADLVQCPVLCSVVTACSRFTSTTSGRFPTTSRPGDGTRSVRETMWVHDIL